MSGGNGGDLLFGGAGKDIMDGGGGFDTLYGGDDDDIMDGGKATDVLYGEGGNDKLTGSGELYGGAGDDTINGAGELYGGTGDDTINGSGLLEGGEGNDSLNGEGGGTLRGGEGDDVLSAFCELSSPENYSLEGGRGNDLLYGSYGSDTYLFDLGDGEDQIIGRRSGEESYRPNDTSDALIFGSGINREELDFVRSGTDLIISHSNGSDIITIEKQFHHSDFKIHQIGFENELFSIDSFLDSRLIVNGTPGDDSGIYGYEPISETFTLAAVMM